MLSFCFCMCGFVLVSFATEFADPVSEQQEGSNSFKGGNPDFQFKEKYCLELCT